MGKIHKILCEKYFKIEIFGAFHLMFSQTYTVQVKYADGYTAGKRVLIKGRLYTRDFNTPQNKNLKRVTVRGMAYPLDEELNQNSSGDVASIQILANVCSDGLHKDDHSILRIVSHIFDR